MIVKVYGWARNHGETVLLSNKVQAGSFIDKDDALPVNKIAVVPFDYVTMEDGKAKASNFREVGAAGAIVIDKAPGTISLNGEYEVRVEIGADELLAMTIAATKNWPLDLLLSMIEKARKASDNA